MTHVALNTSKLVPEGGWEQQDCAIIRPASVSWDPALNPRLHFKYRACKNDSEVNKKVVLTPTAEAYRAIPFIHSYKGMACYWQPATEEIRPEM